MTASGSILGTMSTTQLPTRTLGRTGLQVTQLGYGAMELRGAPRGPAVDDDQAEQVLQAVSTAASTTSTRRSTMASARSASAASSATPLRVFSGLQVWLRGESASPGGRPAHVFTRDNVVAGVEQSLRRLRTDYLDVVQFHASPSRETSSSRRGWRRC